MPCIIPIQITPTKQRSCCLWTTLRSATTGRAFDINSTGFWGFGEQYVTERRKLVNGPALKVLNPV